MAFKICNPPPPLSQHTALIDVFLALAKCDYWVRLRKVKSQIDAGGCLAFVGKSVGEDLLRSARLDMFPMPLTCTTYGITDSPSLLTALRHRWESLGITEETLDEIAKMPDPVQSLKKLLEVE